MSAALAPAAEHAAPQRARLLAYSRFQLRDFLLTKGLGTVLLMALMLFTVYMPFRTARSADPEGVLALVAPAFKEVMRLYVTLGVLFATNGIVAEDRKFGFYRFYFAKPVGVVAFYAQKFATHLIGHLLIGTVLVGAFSVLFAPLWIPAYWPVLALLFVALGGIGFLLSAVTTVDWVSLVGVYFIAEVGWSLYGTSGDWREALVHLLPPVHRIGEVIHAVVHRDPLPGRLLLWLTAYGAACFVLGLVVLARRRLATS